MNGEGMMSVNGQPVGWIRKERKGRWFAVPGKVVDDSLVQDGPKEPFPTAHQARRCLINKALEKTSSEDGS